MVANIESFQGLLQKLNKSCPDAAMYRGQAQDWPLLPHIGRYPEVLEWYENWRVLHDDLIERFLREGRPYLSGIPTEGSDSWVVAQHHGLPTRLIDTTTNPLKALYFAVGDPSQDEFDGCVWAFSFHSWREDLDSNFSEYWDEEVVPFYPAQIHPRLTFQEGSFLCFPLPESTEPLTPLDQKKHRDLSFMKFHIPAKSKQQIRKEIAILGAKYQLLFPDLDGVAKSIRLSILEDG